MRNPTEKQIARMVAQKTLGERMESMAHDIKIACEDGWLFDDRLLVSYCEIVKTYANLARRHDVVSVGPVCERSK